MTICTISDIHGRSVWKEVDPASYDRIIFLGDYVDGCGIDDQTIYDNLVDIIQLKQQQSDKVVLLLGNHDVQYLHFPKYACTGFRPMAQPALSTLFAQHEHLFQVAYQQGRYLFTHAGISRLWLNEFLTKTGHEYTPTHDLADLLNDLYRQATPARDQLFTIGPKRGGSDRYGGPIWADRSETIVDYLPGLHQVVGHTPISNFLTIGDNRGSITYTDVLRTRTAFYEISY